MSTEPITIDPTTTAAAVAAARTYPIEFTLPVSGKSARITRSLKGRDIVSADRVAGKGAPESERGIALIAPVVQIDGKPAVYEDLLDLELEDLLLVMEKGQGNSPTSTLKG